MKTWQSESCVVEKIANRLNEIEQQGGEVKQVLPASNPMNVYVVWYTETDLAIPASTIKK